MPTALPYPPGAMGRDEAAAYIGVSPRTLDKLQAQSEIIPVEIAGVKRFRKVDLDQYLSDRPDWGDRR